MNETTDAPVTETPDAPVTDTPPVADPPADPEAAELAELEQNAVALPDGEGMSKFVPLAAVTKARDEAKQYRQQAKEAATLKAELEKAQQAIAASQPYVEAAKALLATPQPPSQPQGPTPEETAALERTAKLYDFYKTDNSLDLDRARQHQEMVRAEAQAIAAQQIAPYQQQTAVSAARAMLAEAASWEHPVTKEKVDPAILKETFNRIANQPNGMATLSNRESVAVIWGNALIQQQVKNGKVGNAPVAPPPPQDPPVFVETSGGGLGNQPALNAMEAKLAKEMGMTHAEYLKEAAKRPRGM